MALRSGQALSELLTWEARDVVTANELLAPQQEPQDAEEAEEWPT